jgi:hypothetical protein
MYVTVKVQMARSIFGGRGALLITVFERKLPQNAKLIKKHSTLDSVRKVQDKNSKINI